MYISIYTRVTFSFMLYVVVTLKRRNRPLPITGRHRINIYMYVYRDIATEILS